MITNMCSIRSHHGESLICGDDVVLDRIAVGTFAVPIDPDLLPAIVGYSVCLDTEPYFWLSRRHDGPGQRHSEVSVD